MEIFGGIIALIIVVCFFIYFRGSIGKVNDIGEASLTAWASTVQEKNVDSVMEVYTRMKEKYPEGFYSPEQVWLMMQKGTARKAKKPSTTNTTN